MVALKYEVQGDIVGIGQDDEPVVLVKVVAEPKADASSSRSVAEAAAASPIAIPFCIVADLGSIRIYSISRSGVATLESTLPTDEVLSTYEPEFGRKDIYKPYLTSLVDVWLRDVAYRWKSQAPPGIQQLETVGLAQRLQGGTTVTESLSQP